MDYQVTARGRRAYYIGLMLTQELLILVAAVAATTRITLPTVIVVCVLSAFVAFCVIRACRSATLIASAEKVTVFGLAGSRTLSWPNIAGFTAETRPDRMLSLPRTVRRRMLGIQLSSGRTFWLRDLSCRPGPRSGWVDQSAARLNDLAAVYGSQSSGAPAGTPPA
jgi:hypothetical protein